MTDMLAAGIVLVVLGTTAPAAAKETLQWAQVRAGISREQVSGLLGAPLLRNSSRGQERWIYDEGCEVQFERGEVKWWTAPKGVKPAAAPISQHASRSTERRT